MVGQARERWVVRRRGCLLPGFLPGPVGRQVQAESAGGAGEPTGTVIKRARMVPVVG